MKRQVSDVVEDDNTRVYTPGICIKDSWNWLDGKGCC